MKYLIVFVALFAVVLAGSDSKVEILTQDSDVQPEGYKFAVVTSDGTAIDSEGHLKDVGTEHEAIVVHGSYSYVDEKTGEKITVTYTADENGYQPHGSHLPKA